MQARLGALVKIDATSRLTAAQREGLGDFRFVNDVMTRVKAKIKLRLEREKNDKGGEASTADAAEAEENES